MCSQMADAGGLRLADQLLDLAAPQRAPGEPRAQPARRGAHVARAEAVAVGLQPPVAARALDGERQRPVVARGDEVDRRAHQRPLHDAAALQRARQRVALEALQPRPQPDVHRRRVLRLQAAHALERPRDRERRALEQHLAGEQRAVELALGQDARLTARRRARRRDRPSRRRARRPRRGSSGPRRSRAAPRPPRTSCPRARRSSAWRGEARLEREAPPPRTRKRAASSAACGSRPAVDDVAHELEVGLRLHAAAHDPEGPRQAPVAQQQPRDDRVERAPARRDPVGVALLLGEARAAVVQRDPRVAHRHARAEALEDRLDPRHRVALAVHRAQVGRPAARPHARVGCGPRPDPRAAARRRRAASTGASPIVRARPSRARAWPPRRRRAGRRRAPRRCARATSAAAPCVLGGSSQTSTPRYARRSGVDPLGAVRGEVVLGEPARRGDGGRDRPR